MRLGELKLALADLTDDEAEVQVGIMGVISDRKLLAGTGSIEILYRAHPDEPGRGQVLIYSAPTSWPPVTE